MISKSVSINSDYWVNIVSLKLGLLLLLAAMLFVGLGRQAWRMLSAQERQLKQLDKSKLKNLSDDEWDQ